MIESCRGGVTSFEFPHLREFAEVGHAVFTRRDGYSRGPYRSLNTSFGVGDAPARVARNREAIRNSLAAPHLAFARQIHGTEVAIVSQSTDGRAPEADALITATAGRYLAIQVADCQAVVVYDPVRRVVGNIHSGWRGSVGNVIGRALREMTAAFGTNSRDIVAGIGPSLGPCCAEFVNYRREIPQSLWPYRTGGERFDFWSISRDQLRAAGVPAEHIATSALCTRCHTERFFSFRGEGTTGRFAAVIGLR